MAEYKLDTLLETVTKAGTEAGNERLRTVTASILSALYKVVRDENITLPEFLAGVGWLARVGATGEMGLVTAALGFDRLFDILADESDANAGIAQGTPRAIEGPLYIANAPLSQHEGLLDEGLGLEGDILFFSGKVLGPDKKPLANAIVDVWHASPKGGYSHFDPSLPNFAFRRRISTNDAGEYSFRTLMPAGYRVPPGGTTDELLTALGRHGWRPAHIHFMVGAPGFASLTTQINIPGDRYLHDDMAFATRDELIVTTTQHSDPAEIRKLGLTAPFTAVNWDFQLARPLKKTATGRN